MKSALLFIVLSIVSNGFAQVDFEGVYRLEDTAKVELKIFDDHFEGRFTIQGASYRLYAERSNSILVGRVYTAEVGGYVYDMYFEAELQGSELLFSAAALEADGSIDEQNVNSIVLIKQANGGSSPGKLGTVNLPLGNNPINPIASSTIDYSGVYIEQGGTDRLELSLADGFYEGRLISEEAGLTVPFIGGANEDAEKELVGVLYFKEVGGAANITVNAKLSGNNLEFNLTLLNEDGSLVKDSTRSFIFIRQATAGSSQGKIAKSNPLVSVGQGNPPAVTQADTSINFSGRYRQQNIELFIKENGNAFEGEIAFPGKKLALSAQLDGDRLVGKFFATNQEIFFVAKLQEDELILNIANTEYVLLKLSQNSSGGLLSNPLTSQGNNKSQAESQNPIIPVASSSSGSIVQAGQAYQAGMLVSSPATGISFRIPDGFSASYDPQTGYFVVIAEDKVILLQAATQASAWSMASLAIGYLKFVASGEVSFLNEAQETANSLRVSVSGDDTVLHIESKSGQNSTAVVAIATGIEAQTLASFVATINISGAQTQNPVLALGGLALQKEANGKSYEGGLYNKKEEYEAFMFCSDGRYSYEYQSVEDVSMGSYNDTFTESDAHSGQWRAVTSFIGESSLLLEAADGRVLLHSVSQTANSVMVNGFEFQVSQNGQCN